MLEARDKNISIISSLDAFNSKPLMDKPKSRIIAAILLFQSRKGWFMTKPYDSLAIFSIIKGYRSEPSKVLMEY